MDLHYDAELCFPELLNTSCRKPGISRSATLVTAVVEASIALLTALLNLMVIIAVSHFRQLHTSTNLLILSLAVSDFLVGLLLMPANTYRKLSCWYYSNILCTFGNYGAITITSASVGNMVLISVDRYVAIHDPLHYNTRFTEKRVKILIGVCWLSSAAYTGILAKFESLKVNTEYFSCLGQCVIFIDKMIATVDVVVSFVAPVSVIVILYTRVFAIALSQARAAHSQVATLHVGGAIVKPKKPELKAARTIGVVITVFLLCYCPYFIVSIRDYELLNSPDASLAFSVFLINSTLNPLIYALFYPWFRKSIKCIITLQILRPGSCWVNML